MDGLQRPARALSKAESFAEECCCYQDHTDESHPPLGCHSALFFRPPVESAQHSVLCVCHHFQPRRCPRTRSGHRHLYPTRLLHTLNVYNNARPRSKLYYKTIVGYRLSAALGKDSIICMCQSRRLSKLFCDPCQPCPLVMAFLLETGVPTSQLLDSLKLSRSCGLSAANPHTASGTSDTMLKRRFLCFPSRIPCGC